MITKQKLKCYLDCGLPIENFLENLCKAKNNSNNRLKFSEMVFLNTRDYPPEDNLGTMWIKNLTGEDLYSVSCCGALSHLTPNSYRVVWLQYREILSILDEKVVSERYNLCHEFYNKKFPQSEKYHKKLSIPVQEKLRNLFLHGSYPKKKII